MSRVVEGCNRYVVAAILLAAKKRGIRNLEHPLGKPSLVVRTARTRPYALVRGDSRAAPSVRKHKRPLDRLEARMPLPYPEA